ncbi:hypothetical protein D3C77_255510 [compost metagenome]
MKVPTSVRGVYADQAPIYERLEAEVITAFRATMPKRWHFESRVKTLESFCTKLETGRVVNPRCLEDFLGCTLVVPNALDIPKAIDMVEALYTIQYRRPPVAGETKKNADTFRFDDLRLYCARINDGTVPSQPFDDLTFEVQIKTFLQHAWAVATHDLSYKTDDVRWSKDRIVAHLKASIEYAELSIQEADALSRSNFLELRHPRTTAIATIVEAFKATWAPDELPSNLKSLAETLTDILYAAKIDAQTFSALLEQEKSARDGQMPMNVSPYGAAIQILVAHHRRSIEVMLQNNRSPRLLLTPELNLPVDFPPARSAGQVVRLQ